MYESLSYINNSDTISYIIDFAENENEEKKEFDENEKIHPFINIFDVELTEYIDRKPFSNFSQLRNLYIEYATPPPELV